MSDMEIIKNNDVLNLCSKFEILFYVKLYYLWIKVGIGNFDKTKLKRSDTEIKEVLPTAEDIKKEKEQAEN